MAWVPRSHRLGGWEEPERWAPEGRLQGQHCRHVQVSLALEGVVTLCHLGGLGPAAHLTDEEGEAQMSCDPYKVPPLMSGRVWVLSPGLQTSC